MSHQALFPLIGRRLCFSLDVSDITTEIRMDVIRDKGFDNIKLVSLSEEASQEITSNFLRPAGLCRSAFAAQVRLVALGGREPGGSRSPPLRAGLGPEAQLPPLCAAGEVPPSHGG